MSDDIENEGEELEELSLRDSLEGAISEHDEEETQPLEVSPNNEQETPEKPQAETPSAKIEPNAPNTAREPSAPNGSVKPPASWNPKLREQFAKLDPELQAQISKRETEISQALNEGAESRKFGDNMNKIIQPFSSIMAAEGAQNPMQAIHGLLNTAAQLRMGSPQQKAQKIAELIQHYDVDIQTLDSALVGAPTADPQAQQIEQMLESKLAPMQQFMSTVQQTQQQQQQQQQHNAANQVQQFGAESEFLEDVRNDMADLLDLAASRGVPMTLKQAYDKACSIHPDISQVLAQRAQHDKIMGNKQNLASKRRAGSSISGRQVGKTAAPHASDMRSQLMDAWDEYDEN